MTAAYPRVLVTGGAGFIGSHLVDALIDRGRSVTVLDDLSTGHRTNLRRHDSNARCRFIEGSILDLDTLARLVREADIVYHLAAAVGVKHIVADPLRSIVTNVRGTENVLTTAFQSGVPIVLASTSETYGKSIAVPFSEDTDRVLGPTWIHRWSYATAKALDEHLAFAYAEKGLAVSIVRYFNSYGPRIDEQGYGSVIARFAGQALAGRPITVHSDGTQTRCFTFVADTVRGTILASEEDRARGLVLNIGSDEEVSIQRVAELVKEMLGSSSEVQYVPYEEFYGRSFEDTRRRVPDIRRARDVLGFAAEVRFEDGLRQTLEWCRSTYRGVGAEVRG